MKRALALVALLAGCNEIDTRDAEAKVKGLAEEWVAPVKSVSCPSAKRAKGVKLTCTVRFQDGATGKMQLQITDGDGNFTWWWEPWIVDRVRLADSITDALEDQQPGLGTLFVDCGTGVIDVPAEGLPCHVKADKLEQDLVVHAGPDGVAWDLKK